MVAFDVRVFRLLHETFSGNWLPLMVVLSMIGGGWGALMVLPLYLSERTRKLAAVLSLTLGIQALLVFGLKMLVGRVRPWIALEGVHPFVMAPPTDHSFPSGHAGGSFAFATFVAVVVLDLRRPWSRAAAVAIVVLAALVGLSRVALGVHFPGDVLAGAALGSAAGVLGARVYLRLQRSSRTVTR